MSWIGIDPGLKGAIAILDDDRPTFMDITSIKLIGYYRNSKIAIEKQVAMPRQKGANKTAYEFGRLVGHLEAYCLDLTVVRPQTWYTIYGIPAGMKYGDRKKLTAEKMLELYPKCEKDLYGPKGGLLDGRSDALAIAHWLRVSQ